MKIDESAHDMGSLLKAHALGCMDVVARRENARLAPSDSPGLGVAPDEFLIGNPVAVYQ